MKKFLILILLVGCSSSPYKKGDDPYKSALNSAFSEMGGGPKRNIASTKKVIGFKPSDLKSFRMLVFPAQISISKKRNLSEEEKVEFGAPTIFKFRTVLSGKCNTLKRLNTQNSKIFFKDGKFSKNKRCFVIEGKRERPKKWGKMVTRLNRDDTLAIRIFIDEDFRPFGKSIDYALELGRKSFRTVHLKMDSEESLSSELSNFPIDLPNLSIDQSIKKGAVRLPRDFYVISQIKTKVKRPICKSGHQIDFKDFLGRKVMVDFCKGSSWPFAIQTNNFFAILI